MPSALQPLADSHPLGDKNAKVVLIEYSDFQCPFCAKLEQDVLPTIVRDYVTPGKVLLSFRELPLEQMHPAALRAAEIAECAGEQGKFWEMHHALFQNHDQLEALELPAVAVAVGANYLTLQACLAGPIHIKIQDEEAQAKVLRATSTPTIFFGLARPNNMIQVVLRFSGARPLADFRQALDRLLAK